MKKTLAVVFATMSGIAMGASPIWQVTQTDSTHITYTTNQTGTYSFDSLGDATINNGESFSMTMKFVCPTNPFVQGNAISFLAAKAGSSSDLYDINGDDNQFRLYIRPGGNFLQFSVNGWNYGTNTTGNNTSDYSFNIPSDINAETPVIIGVTFTFVNSADAEDGNDYFTISATEDSQVQFSTLTDDNVVKSFNFYDLTNSTSYASAPSDMETTFSITKLGVIPEPSTAALSLLALAGLAMRRRR